MTRQRESDKKTEEKGNEENTGSQQQKSETPNDTVSEEKGNEESTSSNDDKKSEETEVPTDVAAMLASMAKANTKKSLLAEPVKFETPGETRRFIFIGNGESPFENPDRPGNNKAVFMFDDKGKRVFTNYHQIVQQCKNLKGLDDGKKTFIEITYKGMGAHPTDANRTMAGFDVSVVE